MRRPASRGLQDMLVPSIETGSSDALIEPSREVIMINDDSPRPKRRRVVHDELGHFRPLPYYDQVVYSAAPHSESHLIPVSSAQPVNFSAQSPRNPTLPNQGLSRNTQPTFTTLSGGRIPMYDAPMEPAYLPTASSRRPEFGAGFGRQQEVSRRPMSSHVSLPDRGQESSYIRRPLAEDATMVDRGQVFRLQESAIDPRNQTQRPISPCFPVSTRTSRHYEMGHAPAYADHASMRNSPQSRLEISLSKPRDSSNTMSDRPHLDFTGLGDHTQRFENPPARSYTTVRHVPDRPPVQYRGGPM